jgi:lysozyme family protein
MAEPDYDVDFATGKDEWYWENRKEAFIDNLLAREGGEKWHKDAGGFTRFGISQRAHGKEHVIWDVDKEKAKEIYRAKYTKIGEDLFGRTNEAIKFMDMEVNMGYKSDTKKAVQKALNSLLPPNRQIPVDGSIGNATRNAIKTVQQNNSSQKIVDALSKYQLEYYASLPDYKTLERGRKDRASYNPIKED